MKKGKITSILLAATIALTPASTFAHPGRTDSKGGHWNRKTNTYHYHNGGSSTSGSSGSSTDSENIYITTPTYNSYSTPSYVKEEYNKREIELSELEEEIAEEYDELIELVEELEEKYNEYLDLEYEYLNIKNNYSYISSYSGLDTYIPSTSIIKSTKKLYIIPRRSIDRDYDSIWKLDLDYWEEDLDNASVQLKKYKNNYSESKKNLDKKTSDLNIALEELNKKDIPVAPVINLEQVNPKSTIVPVEIVITPPSPEVLIQDSTNTQEQNIIKQMENLIITMTNILFYLRVK